MFRRAGFFKRFLLSLSFSYLLHSPACEPWNVPRDQVHGSRSLSCPSEYASFLFQSTPRLLPRLSQPCPRHVLGYANQPHVCFQHAEFPGSSLMFSACQFLHRVIHRHRNTLFNCLHHGVLLLFSGGPPLRSPSSFSN